MTDETSSSSMTDQQLSAKFSQWLLPSQLFHIRYATALTGLLYILYAQLDRALITGDALELMIKVHMIINPTILFFISLLTFRKRLYPYITWLLVFAPVVAALGNVMIVTEMGCTAIYMSEIYLMIFWIFMISGLRLYHAAVSAIMVYLIVSFATYNLYQLETGIFWMHQLWMMASFLFGLLGAYLLEHSRKTNFMKHVQLEHQAEDLEKLAITDKLTGLYNRGKIDDVLNREINRSHRYERPFGLFLIDIDHFKTVNDTYGHLVGDSVLSEFARILIDNTRSTDVVGRWGGEEFMVIAPDIDEEGVRHLAENLQTSIEHHHYETVGQITASIGMTLYHTDDTTTSIVKRVDSALYQSKEKGRNTIVFL